MKESDVILAPLPQDDEELKYRPAIVLREMPIPYRDLLFAVSVQDWINTSTDLMILFHRLMLISHQVAYVPSL